MSVIQPPAPVPPTLHEPVAPQTSPNIPGSPPGTQFGPAPAKTETDLAKDPANREPEPRVEHAVEQKTAPNLPHRGDNRG